MEENVVIILDVGRNTFHVGYDSYARFLMDAVKYISSFIERKIMTHEDGCVGFILFGTNNDAGVEIVNYLRTPSWQMIRNLPYMPSNRKGDWIKALKVANEIFAVTDMKKYKKRIMLISNLIEPSNIKEHAVEEACTLLKKNNIRVDVVGCDQYSMRTLTDRHLIEEVLNATNGEALSFEEAMKEINLYRKNFVYGKPWDAELSIGPNKFTISCCYKNKDEEVFMAWNKGSLEPTENFKTGIIRNNKIFVNGTSEIKTIEEIVSDYQLGGEHFDMANIDRSLDFEMDTPVFNATGPKSLIIYGFTPACNIHWYSFNGKCYTYIVGQKGNKNSKMAIKSLAHCLEELKVVGIAKGIQIENGLPKMYVIMPLFEEGKTYLVSVCILFREKMKNMLFPPIIKTEYECIADQVEVFKEIVQLLDITNEENDIDYLDVESHIIGATHSVPIREILEQILSGNNAQATKNKAKKILGRLKTYFTTNLTDKDDDLKALLENEIPMDVRDVGACKNNYIGTFQPISDYKICLLLGIPFNLMAAQMTNAIEHLIRTKLCLNYETAFEALLFFKEESLKVDPWYYNYCIRNLKKEFAASGETDVLEYMNAKNIDFIYKHQNELSDFSIEDTKMLKDDIEFESRKLKIISGIKDQL